MKKLALQLIKTKDCLFIKPKHTGEYTSYLNKITLGGYNDEVVFNGEKPVQAWSKDWYITKTLDKPQVKRADSTENLGMKIKDEFKSVKTQKPFVDWRDLDKYFGEDRNMNNYQIYENVTKLIPGTIEDIELDIETIFETENTISERVFNTTPGSFVGKSDLQYSLFDQVICPDLLRQELPVKLTSADSYKIIRNHIKNNIDPKYAEITSDYDFCLTVKKRVQLKEPFTYQANVSLRRKPRFVNKTQTYRDFTIYETAPDGRNGVYQGYTRTEEFYGNNIDDLNKNISEFLEELMKKINEPLKDCPHCSGSGVIV